MNKSNSRIPDTFSAEVFSALENFDRHLYFRWNLINDTAELNPPVPRHSYDIPPACQYASSALWHSGIIHPDDVAILRIFLHIIFYGHARRKDGTSANSCKLRLRSQHLKDYIWSEIHIITYFDENRPVIAFGNIRNIQAQKRWQQRIEREAAHDKLTGLLNKDAARSQISKYLESLSPNVNQESLLLIDADGFKEINDSFGHLFGDAVLSDMGSAIAHNFRQSDIKGRIGGDEFVVLFRNTTDHGILHERCQGLIEKLRRHYKNGNTRLPFSISIGIAKYPDHGTTYQELFKHADRALYESKNQGKSQYTIYRSSLFGQTAAMNHRTPRDFEDFQQKAFKDNMVEFIFKLFYETNSPHATIRISLGMFGKLFNLDRVALDLYSPDTGQYTPAYEWLSPHGVSLKASEHAVGIAPAVTMRNTLILSGYKATSYGVMSICEDTSAADGIYQPAISALRLGSFAHCIVTHGFDTVGCISFESCHPRKFDTECLRSLNAFSVILGNILLTSYSDDKLRRHNERLRAMLNHMQEMIYVVDKSSMIPLYVNQAIHQILPPHTASGQPCYQLLHNRTVPCPGCPVQKLSADGREYIQCELNNWNAERPTCTRACNLHWEHSDPGRPLAMIIQEPF